MLISIEKSQDVSILVGQENTSLGFACSGIFSRAEMFVERQKMIQRATYEGPDNRWGSPEFAREARNEV